MRGKSSRSIRNDTSATHENQGFSDGKKQQSKQPKASETGIHLPKLGKRPQIPFRTNLECVVFRKQGLRLFFGGAHPGAVRAEVVVALLLEPGEGLLGSALEEAVLLVLVQALLLVRPVLQDTVFLGQELLQDDCKGNKDSNFSARPFS